jgi:glyoxylase-like metal-dependent hydrolase (beta-lactamase superfamily II)
MPLPLRLNHVNVWLLTDADGWTAIDCGLDSAETRAAWEKLAVGPLAGKPVRRLIATHGHVDHVGLAGWFTSRFGVPFQSTLAAWLWARVTYAGRSEPTSAEALEHLRIHGCNPRHIEAYARNRGTLLQHFGAPPRAHIRLKDGGELEMGGRCWRIVTADGHADEHASFLSMNGDVVIAGDQILQRISPVVGVFAGEPSADPLTDYLASLQRFRDLPAETLVLPSHGLPFRGLKARLNQLELHHRKRLDLALSALDRPLTATECAHVLFDRAMAEGQWFLALAETLAHLHRLETLGEAEREADGNGVIRFVKRARSK